MFVFGCGVVCVGVCICGWGGHTHPPTKTPTTPQKTNNPKHRRFASALRPPPSFSAPSYLAHAILACEQFLQQKQAKQAVGPGPEWIPLRPNTSSSSLNSLGSLAQCLSRPHGSLPLRAVAWGCDLLLPRCFAFASAATSGKFD